MNFDLRHIDPVIISFVAQVIVFLGSIAASFVFGVFVGRTEGRQLARKDRAVTREKLTEEQRRLQNLVDEIAAERFPELERLTRDR